MKVQDTVYDTVTQSDQFLSLGAIISKCIKHLPSYIVIFCATSLLALLYIVTAQPLYTATALIGSPDTMSSLTSGSSSVGASLIGKLSGSTDDDQKFDEFTEVLTSNDLARAIAQKNDVLPLIFYQNWDGSALKWKNSNPTLFAIKSAIKTLFHLPIKNKPDSDDLARYLDRRLDLRKVTPLTSSTLGRATPLVSVSFSYKDPKKAEYLLRLILDTADEILRDEKKRDVAARIKYLQSLVPTITSTEQKEALIAVLSSQLQQMAMVQTDSRFSSMLVDAPFASLSPTSPNILLILIATIFVSAMVWSGLIFLLPVDHVVLRWLDIRWWRQSAWRQPSDARGDAATHS